MISEDFKNEDIIWKSDIRISNDVRLGKDFDQEGDIIVE